MSCWQTLGIERTSDQKEIKRAYARLLKQYNPEEDAVGYQRLRAAYDQAIASAKADRQLSDAPSFTSGQEDGSSPEDQSFNTSERTSGGYIPKSFGQFSTSGQEERPFSENKRFEMPEGTPDGYVPENFGHFEKQPEIVTVTAELIQAAEALYRDYPARNDPKKWLECLNRRSLERLDDRAEAEKSLLQFLYRHHHLPQSVYRAIGDFFNWPRRDRDLQKHCPEWFAEYLLDRYQVPSPLHYDNVAAGLPYEELERFFSLKESAFKDFVNNDLPSAAKSVEEAMTICDTEPDILKIAIACYRLTGQQALALSAAEKLVQAEPQNEEALYLLSFCNLGQGNVQQALEQAAEYVGMAPEDVDGALLLGRCELNGHLDGADSCFEHAHDLSRYDIEPLLYLSALYTEKLKKLRSLLWRHFFSRNMWDEINGLNRKRNSLPPFPSQSSNERRGLWFYFIVAALLPLVTALSIILGGFALIPSTTLVILVCARLILYWSKSQRRG